MKISTLLKLAQLASQSSRRQNQLRRKRQVLTPALFSGDAISRFEAWTRGFITLSTGADTDTDAATFAFGSTEAYEEFMALYFNGEIDERQRPIAGCVALYLDHEDNLVHMGWVVFNRQGKPKVISKITDSPYVIRHDPLRPPTDIHISRTLWVNRPERMSDAVYRELMTYTLWIISREYQQRSHP